MEASPPEEPAEDCMFEEFDGEESLEARRNFLAVCLPEYAETAPTHKPVFPRQWLKRALFVGTFTAWTAAAIALAIALG